MPPVGFEPTISAGERPKTYALDRAATGTGDHPTREEKKSPRVMEPDVSLSSLGDPVIPSYTGSKIPVFILTNYFLKFL